jgi:8-oxo-dGTP pyrophosphatase MutT (NUDIX family)
MLALLDGEEDPWSRSSFQPGHFTASTFVLDPTGERLLLILHRSLHLWLQPGGHFERGDRHLEEAARREVLEETGIADLESLDGFPGLFDVDIHPIPANPARGEPAHEHFDLRLAFRSFSDDLLVSAEVADARWVGLAELANCGTDESVVRAGRKLIGDKQACSALPYLL